MSMVVKNNMQAVQTLNVLNQNSSALQKSLAKVSSGMKINSAQDDAAGFAISEKMREQIRSLEQDSQNIQNASSLIKVAEGAVSSTVEILKTIKEKAIDAANDTNTDRDRAIIQKEIDQFMDQVNDNALVTFNGKYLLDGSTSTVEKGDGTGTVDEDAKNAVLKGLSSEWVQASLDLINQSFGINFSDGNAGVTEIDVQFENEDTSNLAYVTSSFPVSGGSKALSLTLTVNMKYYNDIDTTSADGASSSTSMLLDRTLAHEFTHAAMAANIVDFGNLPKWFKEGGSAELVHGADDARAVSMVNLLQNPTTLQATLNGTSDEDDNVYAAGYMLSRYMIKTAIEDTTNTLTTADRDPVKIMTTLMQRLASSSGNSSDFDSAINAATGGTFTTQAGLISSFMSEVNNASTNGYDLTDKGYTALNPPTSVTWNANGVFAFMKDKLGIDTKYYNNIDDPDTGAVTGSDAGGGTAKDQYDIVKENTSPSSWSLPTTATSTYSGLTVNWPDGTTSQVSSNGTYTFGERTMTEKKLKMQVGTKANQATNVGFYDMRTKSLGTLGLINTSKSMNTDTGVFDAGYFVHEDDESRFKALGTEGVPINDAQKEWLTTLTDASNKTLDDISVTTKKNANIAIRVIDGAIDYALNQQTDIGSYLQRFDYTGANVTIMNENIQAAESTIRDADMAKEMTNYTKNNVLLQAAQSMLAQANQSSSAVLSLLQ